LTGEDRAVTICCLRERKALMSLYTKHGRPLQVSDDKVYTAAGTIVGRMVGAKVYGTSGQYVGSIVGERLVFQSSQSGTKIGSFAAGNIFPSPRAHQDVSAIAGEEPAIPD
jgi:hypothetical protein